MKSIMVTATSVAALAFSAQAVPTFDSFGPFPNATFGGTGIPNDSVAASTQFVADFDTASGTQSAQITLAMNATQRFFNPALTNDGVGTFFATPGTNFGDPNNPGPSATEGAVWNFNYYILVEGINGSTPEIDDFQIDLLYDFDPAENTAVSERGRIDITAAAFGQNLTLVQDSQNLNFGFLTAGVPFVVTPPSPVTTFDADALGEYNFAIEVKSLIDGSQLESVGIDVDVVPEPASLALLGLGGLAMIGRRR